MNYLNDGILKISAERNLGAATNDVTFGGGTLQVTAGFTATSGKVFAVAASMGTLDIDNGQTLTLGSSGNMTASAGGMLIKSGEGDLVISNANASFDGSVLCINSGKVKILTSTSAVGDGDSTIRLNGGNLEIADNTGRTFTCTLDVAESGTVTVNRASSNGAVTHGFSSTTLAANKILTVNNGSYITSSYTGQLNLNAVTLNGSATILTDRTFAGSLKVALTTVNLGGNTLTVDDAAGAGGVGDCNITGVISGVDGKLTKQGGGTLTYTGGTSTYTGLTKVLGGVYALNPSAAPAIPGDLEIGNGMDSATVRTTTTSANRVISDTGSVTINANATLAWIPTG
jgi:autotransporter-associated beta strand protein